ncbi:MAG TPA: SAM-dependent methyltransferase [Actinomycetota bacterium]
MSEQVARRIRGSIRERGPITFEEFMDHALYGPGGFYERPPVGAERHFVTSPHVHPVFSRLVGVALEELWVALGRPVPFRLVEAGAGDGTLARELLGGFERGGIELSYAAVEASGGARRALSELAGVSVAERLADVGAVDPGVVFANELLDNLPFRRVRLREALVEVRVGLEGDRLVEVEAPCDEDLAAIAPGLEPGEEAAIPVGALRFVDETASVLTRGYALLIDYGSLEGPAGEVHGYRGHRVRDDVLEDPGSADITAGVSLGLVVARAESVGLSHLATVPQWAALSALGYDEWARSELARQGDLLEGGRGLEAVRAWEARGRARLLLDPGALGRLRWLVLATEGQRAPAWLERARALASASDRPSG